MSYQRILVDCSSEYHACYHTSKHLTFKAPTGETIVTGGIHTFLKRIQKIDRTYLSPGGSFYFLFDNTTAVEYRRRDMDPEYKVNRTKQEPVFYQGLNLLNMILMNYQKGNYVFQNPGSEADDLVSVLLPVFPASERILLVSRDLDWARGIGPRVDWLTPIEKLDTVVDEAKFKELHGYLPSRESICMFKAFHGDTSDGIPNAVPGIPQDTLKRLVCEPYDLKELLRRIKLGEFLYLSDTFREKTLQAEGRLKLNYRLVDYLTPADASVAENILTTAFNPKTLTRLYTFLGFDIPKLDNRPELRPSKPKASVDNLFKFATYERA